MIKITQTGDYSKLDKYFNKSLKVLKIKNINQVAEKCLLELIEVTPKGSGLTASSWNYEVIRRGKNVSIQFNNTNIQNGLNVALLLEFGHGTKNGSWIEGKNYIDPVTQKAYLDILDSTWKEMTGL